MTHFFSQPMCTKLDKAGIKEDLGWWYEDDFVVFWDDSGNPELEPDWDGCIPAFTKYSILEPENAKLWWGEKQVDKDGFRTICGELENWQYHSHKYLDLIQEGKTIEELENYLEETRG